MSEGTRNCDRQSLRGFLQLVERDFPEEILRIRAPVRKHLDITSIVFELERAGKSPVVVYENVEGSSMPIVTNIAGNRTLLAAGPPEQLLHGRNHLVHIGGLWIKGLPARESQKTMRERRRAMRGGYGGATETIDIVEATLRRAPLQKLKRAYDAGQ
jgi:3-polyprenyl-4-hydroxybenzoate decarboxylase